MKITLAQTKSLKGDIEANIRRHQTLIRLAVASGAEMIIFPELSITGYEPTLANELATSLEDKRFAPFQLLSDSHHVTIGIGVPLRIEAGITISLALFQPNKKAGLYSKQYLHRDEEPFFVSGQNTNNPLGEKSNIALAICYELSVPAHAELAVRRGAEIYLASVAKKADGVNKAVERLTLVAKQHSMFVLMVNCVGWCDNMLCGGRSAAWSKEGKLLAQLDDSREGILLVDTETEKAVKNYC